MPARIINYKSLAMGVKLPFYCSRAHTFARALAYKYIFQCGGSALTDSDGSLWCFHYIALPTITRPVCRDPGGATGPRASCVTGRPSTLPFSHSALQCHRITRYALQTITRPVYRDRRRDRAAHRRRDRAAHDIREIADIIGH